MEDAFMLSSYAVVCPQAQCGWTGNLVPSRIRGGEHAEIVSTHRAWFRCPLCQGDWELRITLDKVTVLPVIERGSATRNGLPPKPSRAVAFDVDAASMVSLREALPTWEIATINGATAASLAHHWDPVAADLLIVTARDDATATLGLCRFLSFCTRYATEARDEGAKTLHLRESLPPFRLDAPLLVLAPPGHDTLVGAALEAGARSCLVLPIHAKDVASVLTRVHAAHKPGRHTLNLDQAPMDDHWRDDGGQG
jgi:hypothetical protein